MWIVDDTASHRQCALATVAQVPGCAGEAFADPEEAIAEFARRAAEEPTALPRVILMDFYLGAMHGDEATERIRAIATPLQPIIVGYSSVPAASQRIVDCGGDLVLRKRRAADGTNPELRAYLESLWAIAGNRD